MSGATGDRLGAAILAGGQATRYGGTPKGLLEIAPGLTIIENEIRQLRGAGLNEIVIVANDARLYSHLGLETVADLRPGRGPLAGMEAALAHWAEREGATLFLPCDLPGITAGEIRRLVEAFATSGSRVAVGVTEVSSMQPLCTVLHNGLLREVSAALEEGEGSPGRLWRRLEALQVPFEDAEPFCNVNSPEDLAAWLARRKHSGTYQAERACGDA